MKCTGNWNKEKLNKNFIQMCTSPAERNKYIQSTAHTKKKMKKENLILSLLLPRSILILSTILSPRRLCPLRCSNIFWSHSHHYFVENIKFIWSKWHSCLSLFDICRLLGTLISTDREQILFVVTVRKPRLNTPISFIWA